MTSINLSFQKINDRWDFMKTFLTNTPKFTGLLIFILFLGFSILNSGIQEIYFNSFSENFSVSAGTYVVIIEVFALKPNKWWGNSWLGTDRKYMDPISIPS